jgi:YlqD protein
MDNKPHPISMDIPTDQLLLRRAINIKAVVTPRWKEEAQQQLQASINQIDMQLQQLELQAQQMITELRKQGIQVVGAEGIKPTDSIQEQIQQIQLQANTRKSELLEQKNQILQQLNQVQFLQLDQEVDQGQIDNFFYIGQGDNLIQKMQLEILLRDGVIEQIRSAGA